MGDGAGAIAGRGGAGAAWAARLARDPVLRGLARAGLATIGIKLLGAALAFAMMVAVARATGPEAFGAFGFGFALAMLASVVAGGGLCVAVMRWRPEHEVRGEPATADAAERFGMNRTLLGAGLALLAGATAAAAVGVVGPALGTGLPPHTLLAAGALAAPFAISSYAAGALRARGRTAAALAPRDVIWRAAVAGGAILSAGAGLRLGAAEALWGAAAVLWAVTLAQIALWGPRPGRTGASAARRRAWRAQARPMWIAAMIGGGQRSVEVVLVGLLLPPAATGLYVAAATVAQGLSLAWIAATMAAAPALGRALHGGGEDLARLLRLVAAASTLPTLAGVGVLAFAGDRVLGSFDPAFADGLATLLLLAAASAVTAMSGAGATALSLGGGERAHLRLVALATFAATAVQLVAAPLLGPPGAALGALVGAVALALGVRRACLRRIGADPTVAAFAMRADGRRSLLMPGGDCTRPAADGGLDPHRLGERDQ